MTTTAIELCPNCETPAHVVRERREVPLGQRRLVIDDERMRCEECGEEFYTTDQADRRQRLAVEQARLVDGLLLPAEIRRIREHLQLTQRQFELLLGVGEKTAVRWESGRVSQNKATDRLIRLLAASRDNVRLLAGINAVVLDEPESATEIVIGVVEGPANWPALAPAVIAQLGGSSEATPLSRQEELSVIRDALSTKPNTVIVRPSDYLTSSRPFSRSGGARGSS